MKQSILGLIRVVALTTLFLTFSSGIIHAASAPSPEVIKGLTWLQTQVQPSGALANEAASIATPLQSRAETLQTLNLLATVPAALADQLAADTEDNTEYLARRTITLTMAGRDASTIISLLMSRQNLDGGFGGAAGMESNPLDTALVLLVLKTANYSNPQEISAAFTYLQATQLASGGYSGGSAEDIYISATVLKAFSAYAGQFNLNVPLQKLVAYLIVKQTSPGNWDNSIYLSSVSYSALHEFIPLEPTASSFKGELVAKQLPDGSWDSDPFATALALRALFSASTEPANPTLSIVRAKVVDSQTGLPMAGVAAKLSGSVVTVVTSGIDGIIEFRNVPPGSYSVQISLANYGTLSTSVVTQADRVLDLGTLQMSKVQGATTGTVQGVIKDASGAGLLDVVVSANGVNAITDATGQYLISNVTPGAVALQAVKAGYTPVASTGNLSAGGVLVFSPLLSAGNVIGTSVQGHVIHAVTKQPLAGVLINLSGNLAGTTVTDATGSYLISNIQPGSGGISASLSGYDTVAASLNLAANTTLNFSPALYPVNTTPPNANKAAISGVVVDAGTNLPLANATVTATISGVVKTLQSDADGRFLLNGITALTANLKFSLAGYGDSSVDVALEPISQTDIGQVRLRKTKVDVLLPDFYVKSLNRQGLVNDAQTLTLSGSITAEIVNKGTSLAPGYVEVLAFSDVNRNGVYDDGIDLVLGRALTHVVLYPGAAVLMPIPVQGTLPFRDAPIYIWVDSAQAVSELSEANNIASTAEAAQIKPSIGTFKPVLKWEWTKSAVLPAYNQVMSLPIVMPIEDTNGDGKIDQHDIPGVIFNSYSGVNYSNSDGVLRAISGKDGREIWSVSDPAYRTNGEGSIAAADLDGDGFVDIVAPKKGGGIIAFDNKGNFKWQNSLPTVIYWGAISIADLDGDGKAEIIVGNTVFNFDGSLRWQGSGVKGGNYASPYNAAAVSIVADINLDGKPVIVAGGSAYSGSGQLLWQNDSTVGEGYTAIGNFNSDPYPEIVVVSNGRVFLLDHLGAKIWGPVYLPGGGKGGPPTVADMDGDGIPEIGVAGYSRYATFKSDGSLFWSSTIRDYGSNLTGSSVFDFDGDGKAEIAYADELNFRVFRSADGSVLFQVPNSSGTLIELPVIADIDNDNHADIVLASNQLLPLIGYVPGPGTTGVRAFQDANNSWVNTRKIWNQHSYHITNINDDGSVPRIEQNSWQTHNTYRLNANPGLSATAVADLTASYLRIEDWGGTRPSVLTVRVGNAGALEAKSGIFVAFYNGQPGTGGVLLGTSKTATLLEPGMYEDVKLNFASLSGIQDLVVVVDDNGSGVHAIDDFNRANNLHSIQLVAQPTSLNLSAITDAPVYGANSVVTINATIQNQGSFDATSAVRYTIESSDGLATVAVLPLQTSVIFAHNSSLVIRNLWNTGTTYTGTYRARVELIGSNGVPFVTAFAPFAIVSTSAVGAQVTLDKLSYLPFDAVKISGRISNLTQNEVQSGLQAVLTVYLPDGTLLWTQTGALQQLLAGSFVDLGYGSQLSAAPAGNYRVSLTVLNPAAVVVARAETFFNVLSTAGTGSGLKGVISALPKVVPHTDPVILDWTVSNLGNAGFTALPITVSIVDPATQLLMLQQAYSVDIAQGKSFQTAFGWNTETATIGTTYVAILTASVAGKDIMLASANFQVIEPPVKLDVKQSSVRENRVLVWLACDAEEGKDTHDDDKPGSKSGNDDKVQRNKLSSDDDHKKAACIQTRTAYLQTLLTSLNIDYLITSTREDFRNAFRGGRYNTYWLSGKGNPDENSSDKDSAHKKSAKQESDHKDAEDHLLAREIREAVYRGDGLIFDGKQPGLAKSLQESLGIKNEGQLSLDNAPATTTSLLYPAGQLPTMGRAQKMLVTTGIVQANFDAPIKDTEHHDDAHEPHQDANAPDVKDQAKDAHEHHGDDDSKPEPIWPAIISNDYGKGHALAFAFDLVDTLQNSSAATGWTQLLQTGLGYVLPPLPDNYSAGAYVALNTRIQNLAKAVDLAVSMQLPAGATLLQTAPVATLDANGQPTWRFTLPLASTRSLLLSMRLPALTGSYTARTYIDNIRNGKAKRYGEYAYSWTVAASDRLASNLTGDLQALVLPTAKEREARDQALYQLNKATTFIANAQYAEALESLLKAVEKLRKISSVDTSTYRLSLDTMLQETAWNWLRTANL